MFVSQSSTEAASARREGERADHDDDGAGWMQLRNRSISQTNLLWQLFWQLGLQYALTRTHRPVLVVSLRIVFGVITATYFLSIVGQNDVPSKRKVNNRGRTGECVFDNIIITEGFPFCCFLAAARPRLAWP